MRWKRGILTKNINTGNYGHNVEYPKGTEVLIGGEEFLGNQMVYMGKIGERWLTLKHDEVAIGTTEELRVARMVYD